MNTIICGHCNGTGETTSTELYRGRRCTTWLRCMKCQGTGIVDAPAQPEPSTVAATVLMVAAVAQVESREDALRRLLVVARESGVQLKRDDAGDIGFRARPAVPCRSGFLRVPRLSGLPPLPARCRPVGTSRFLGRARG
jgi:hypothetical protein